MPAINNDSLTLRPIEKRDNSQMEQIIRQVMTEFGATGAGFAIHDPEVPLMFETYQHSKSAFYVISDGARIWGGGGFAPLPGVEHQTCEIRKMYFLPELRGLGWGKKVLETCLKGARERGFQSCYLETLKTMKAAKKLYEAMGFDRLHAPMGNTGHFGCDAWYLKKL